MRDPARIDFMLDTIGRIWKEEPDTRLAQLLAAGVWFVLWFSGTVM